MISIIIHHPNIIKKGDKKGKNIVIPNFKQLNNAPLPKINPNNIVYYFECGKYVVTILNNGADKTTALFITLIKKFTADEAYFALGLSTPLKAIAAVLNVGSIKGCNEAIAV